MGSWRIIGFGLSMVKLPHMIFNMLEVVQGGLMIQGMKIGGIILAQDDMMKWVDQRSEQTYAEYTRLMEEARSQQTQHTETGEPIECPPIDEDLVWNQTVGGPSNKNRIYGKGTYYADRVSVSSETGGSTAVVDDDVRERVHLLNSELFAQAQTHQRQMEALKQQVVKLQEEREKEKEKNEKEKKRLKMELRKEMMKEMRKGMFEYMKNIQAGNSSNPIPPVMDDVGDGSGDEDTDGDGDGDGDGGNDGVEYS